MQRVYGPALLVLVILLLALPGSDASGLQAQPSATQLASAVPSAAPEAQLSIQYPLAGQALQGRVPVGILMTLSGIQSADLEFSYANQPASTWFPISLGLQAASGGMLVQWDTTTITDGIYNLRLTAALADGSRQSVVVDDLRVRNYTAVETDTPAPVTPTATLAPSQRPGSTQTPVPTVTLVPPTATLLPPNPAQLSRQEVTASLGKGVLAAVGIFALVGLYQSIKSSFRRRE